MIDGDRLVTHTIFNGPVDFPDKVVVRGFIVGPQAAPVPQDEVALFDDVDDARRYVMDLDPTAVCLTRSPEDHPNVVETWI